MRILHAISNLDPRWGGPTTALLGLAAAQQRAGLDVHVVSTFMPGYNPETVQQLESAGVRVHMIGPVHGRLGRHPQLASTVADLTKASDVVHIHALWEEIQHQAAASSRRAGVPYIFRPCGMLDPWSLNQSRLVKRLYMAWRLRRDFNGAAMLHFTAEIERDLVQPLGLSPRPIVVPNGVNLDEFAHLPPRGTFRARYPQVGDRPLIIFMSRIHHKKGLDLLIPAFAQAALPDAMLAIAGPESDYVPTVQALVKTHGVTDRVIFIGMLRGADRVAALADADLFVLPSYQENFGIAVVEALAAGCPVVISNQVNIHREIAASALGGVVPLRIDALANELRRWMTDAALRQSASAKARPFVTQNYDWNNIAARWKELYQSLPRGMGVSPMHS